MMEKPDFWPEKYWVSDGEIDAVWGSASFGTSNRREVIRQALAQIAGGYSTGSTATSICVNLGLVRQNRLYLTKKGSGYLYHANNHIIKACHDPQA